MGDELDPDALTTAAKRLVRLCWQSLPADQQTPENVAQLAAAQVARVLETTGPGARAGREYERWTEAEDRTLEERVHAGVSPDAIARELRRDPKAVRSRMRKRGLVG